MEGHQRAEPLRGGAAGLRTDLEDRARPVKGSDALIPHLRAIIEVKGSWHPQVLTALRDQSVDDYLHSLQIGHGMYVIGDYTYAAWGACDAKRRRERLGGTAALTQRPT